MKEAKPQVPIVAAEPIEVPNSVIKKVKVDVYSPNPYPPPETIKDADSQGSGKFAFARYFQKQYDALNSSGRSSHETFSKGSPGTGSKRDATGRTNYRVGGGNLEFTNNSAERTLTRFEFLFRPAGT